MNFQIDVTQIIIAILGIVSTIVMTIVVPYVSQLWQNSKIKNTIDKTNSEIAKNELLANQLDELRKIVAESVSGAAERLWQEKGIAKREDAMKQVKIVLEQQGLTFDDELISKTMDAAVDSWRNTKVN